MLTLQHTDVCAEEMFLLIILETSPKHTPFYLNQHLSQFCVSSVYYALQRGGGKQILVMNRSRGKCRHCNEQIELCRGVWVKKKKVKP